MCYRHITMAQTNLKNYYGTKLYSIVALQHPTLAGKIVGMFLEAGVSEFDTNSKIYGDKNVFLEDLCSKPEFLEDKIKEALELLGSSRDLESVGTSVRKKFSNLVFRRINYVQSFNPKYFLVFPSIGDSDDILQSDSDVLQQKDLWKQYGDEKSDDFCGFTSHFSLRPKKNDPYKGKQMPFSKQGYAVLDPITLEMVPTKCSITPRTGDLICGIVDTENEEPYFDKWFVCSEQFYRCYTMSMFRNHISFKNAQKKKSPREYWMSGNRLMTNSYLKWLYSLNEHGMPCNLDEKTQKYWKLRTEPMSVNWIHIYCAIVYLVRYKEFPSPKEVPMNKGGLKYSKWHLPENWVNDFVNFHSS